jgi:hypothetical protein
MRQKFGLHVIMVCPVILVAILGVATLMISALNHGKLAQRDFITNEDAVKSALLYAKDDYKTGGIVGEPTEIRGATMTYSHAVQLIFGKKVDSTKDTVRAQDSLVWVIALEGSFVSHVPAAPGIPSQDVTHTQMYLIIDGKTSDLIEQVFVSPRTRVDVSSLPVLPITGTRVLATPTKGSLVLDSPLATATPVH